MKTFNNLYHELISPENLHRAYHKARKGKTTTPAVLKFEEHLQLNLATLYRELKTKTYRPRPLKTFILRDPKTRKICVSDFRDRVVHHALVNILQPIFETRFIHDSYASRKGKGTTTALKRFETFLRRFSKNGTQKTGTNANHIKGFTLKADIKHYFETVNHQTLINIIAKHVKDNNVLWLVRIILDHHHTKNGKGMPLGNWTSQFFANVYLNELDQYVKQILKIKYYLRYVDDFIIIHRHKHILEQYQAQIQQFLTTIKLDLHPTKTKIAPLCRGTSLLGFRIFYHYKIPRQRNIRKAWKRLNEQVNQYAQGNIDAWKVLESLQGWNAYAMQGNTHHLRQRVSNKIFEQLKLRTCERIKK